MELVRTPLGGRVRSGEALSSFVLGDVVAESKQLAMKRLAQCNRAKRCR